jgi:hypothetical protein
MDDWFGMANMRIQRPRMRKLLTVLKDWEPPETWAMARVRPWVGRTEPVLRGIQSIWFLKTAVWASRKPPRLQTETSFEKSLREGDVGGKGGTYQVPMLLRTNPHMAITPLAQLPQLLHLRMNVLDVVFDGEAGGVEDAYVAAEAEENPGGFVS